MKLGPEICLQVVWNMYVNLSDSICWTKFMMIFLITIFHFRASRIPFVLNPGNKVSIKVTMQQHPMTLIPMNNDDSSVIFHRFSQLSIKNCCISEILFRIWIITGIIFEFWKWPFAGIKFTITIWLKLQESFNPT